MKYGLAIGLLLLLVAGILFAMRSDAPKAHAVAPNAQTTAPTTTVAPELADKVRTERASSESREPTREVARPEDGGRHAGRIHGVVVDDATDRPLAGVEVRYRGLTLSASVRNRLSLAGPAVSDVDGRFSFERRGTQHWFDVQPPSGWDSVDGNRLERDDREDDTQVVFRLRRVATASIAGRVVDVRTREPLPDYALELRGSTSETVTTDATGAFATTNEFELGALVAAPLEPRGAGVITVHHAGADARLEVPVPVGPTYLLELIHPPELASVELLAQVRAPDSELRAGPRRHGARVRRGPPAWVRLPAAPLGHGPFELSVYTTGERWLGTAPVQTTRGRAAGVVTIVLRSAGAVSARVTDERGLGVGRISVALRPTAGGPSELARVDRDGLARWPVVLPGHYQLTARHDEFESPDVGVLVSAGSDVTVHVQVTRRKLLEPVRGTVRPRSGNPAHGMAMLLHSLDDTGSRYSVEIDWEQSDGPAVGTFVFERVPAGDYELRPSHTTYRTRPESVRVLPTAGPVAFEVLDDLPSIDLRLFVHERGSEASIARFTLVVERADGGRHTRVIGGKQHVDMGRFPVGEPLRFTVRAVGFRSFTGDEHAFEERHLEDGQRLGVARVQLERGWSARIHVRGPDGDAVAGAVVRADGASLGSTDATGWLTASSDTSPERLAVDYLSWHLLASETDGEVLRLRIGP